ncbi:MAG: CvpA family protein [Verrucomicrobiota bacterium]|nr:CvpA family protein [Verrucomicrobiota bacterium]
MKAPDLNLSWFDLLVIAVLLIGVWRGKKRGMSEELLEVLQWLAIIMVSALIYKALGDAIADYTRLSVPISHVIAYVVVAILIKLLFTTIKKAVGEKLVQSDAFGPLEYYLGMMAGALRFFCVLLFLLSLLHSVYISEAERKRQAQVQQENFGSISFPTIGSLQQSIFYESASGPLIRKYLKAQLIEPVQAGPRRSDNIIRRRERSVDEIIENR